jgi:phosphatidate cytidylyltransferase
LPVASGLRQRIATGLLLAGAIVVVLFALPPVAAITLVALAVLAGAWEWAGFAGCRGNPVRLGYAAAIGIAALAAWQFTADAAGLTVFLYATALWWWLAVMWVVFAPARGGRMAAALAGFAVLVPAAICLSRLALVEPHGRMLFFYLIVLVAAADVGAYFGGRSFGRHKLAPLVSPGKTWEGFVAGMAGAALVAVFGAMVFELPMTTWLAACAPVALLSVVGDLVESMFKRRAGLKDSGGLLPGHGGVLDRVDGLTAAGPAFLLALQLIGVAA